MSSEIVQVPEAKPFDQERASQATQQMSLDMSAYRARMLEFIERAKKCAVVDQQSSAAAVQLAMEIREMRSEVEKEFEPGTKFFHGLHKAWTTERAKWTGPLDALDKLVSGKAVAFIEEQRRQEIARQRAEAERLEKIRLEQEATAARERILSADPWDEAPEVPAGPTTNFTPSPLAATLALPDTGIAGMGIRNRPWRAKVDDFGSLIVTAALAILRNRGFSICLTRGEEKLEFPAGKATDISDYLLPNTPRLDAKAVEVGEQISTLLPGISACRSIGLSRR